MSESKQEATLVGSGRFTNSKPPQNAVYRESTSAPGAWVKNLEAESPRRRTAKRIIFMIW